MFYGQIMIHKYLQNPSISFCAIGDHTSDDVPLQCSEFGQGKGVDQLLSKMFLEGGGGDNQHESYELSAFFYQEHCSLRNHDYPFFFVTGDEGYWDQIQEKALSGVLGSKLGKNIKAIDVWKKLQTKYNVFLIKKAFWNTNYEYGILTQWQGALGMERVLEITSPKACIDIMLGAIAITTGTSLDQYIKDMKQREQTNERIEEVVKALKLYASKVEAKQVKIIKGGGPGSYVNNSGHTGNISTGSQKDFTAIKEMAEKSNKQSLSGDKLETYKKFKKLSLKLKGQIPKEIMCPLTEELFFDPVMTSDGTVFERKAIEIWLQTKNTNPITDSILTDKNLIPNIVMRQLSNTFYDKNK